MNDIYITPLRPQWRKRSDRGASISIVSAYITHGRALFGAIAEERLHDIEATVDCIPAESKATTGYVKQRLQPDRKAAS